jgi:spore maturation protein CgeB
VLKNKAYKLLHVGDFNFDYYDESLFCEFNNDALIEADKFQWSHYFSNYQYKNLPAKLYYSFENRYKCGLLVKKLNCDLLQQVRNGRYDIIFLWRAIHIYPSTIRELKSRAVVIGYNNDQTFSKHHPWWLFYLLKRSIPFYDHYFVYRASDKEDIESLGCSSSVFMPTFDASRVYPIDNMNKKYDVAFIGHYEDDGRDQLLLLLIKAGFKLRLDGQRWQKSPFYNQLKSLLGKDVAPAYEGYNEALNSAKVCLSFLSKLNNDTYTRRTLEIPASRTVMLAEYTADQAVMFKPDVEAVYFSNHKEAVDKLRWLCEEPLRIERIATAGYNRVFSDSYQLHDRVDEVIKIAQEKIAIKNEK